MALQSQAQLLDELMGKNRNIAPGARINQVRFDDEDVCKFALCGFCPHDLFVNTRADLGPCNKIHDEQMKIQYEKSSRYNRLGYEDDYERFLRSLLSDVERKIKRGQERLRLTQTENSTQKTPIQMKQERVSALKDQINDMIKTAEHFGEEGRIEEAQQTLEGCEKLKAECKYLETQLDFAQNNLEQKQMEVCEVCGSFLIINDAQSRVEEHVSGKQHMGYAKLRAALDELRKKRLEEYEKRDKERIARSKEDSSRPSDRDRDRDRERHRDRDPERRSDKDRDRDRDRDRKVSSRDRSRERRNGSSKKETSRSRSRDKDKQRSGSESNHKRGRHSRSKSRDRKRRSQVDGDKDKVKKNLKLEQETDEFLKIVDNLTSKKAKKSNEEKEEGEEDDTEVDEGEIRA